ncbi:PHB depolymerase family esterase [Zavarzinia compransoris]|uniref:extracellular catalytic domain type 1 short-chain-length polyhydroxyalkanoate depolymerase n=1 Tax=Zavarzinia marina TaxID=2911065 RepID=UPI001F259666|nr:PHB depolymerase family esterase [Zavarzinia marina]MCF4166038.1 PHB depolymerase family esterase [Zavarzinia marina]
MLRILFVILAVMAASGCALQRPVDVSRATDYEEFGPNPAGLSMKAYVPAGLAPGAPLVVALHHCFQHAEEYADETGWLTLADQYGFAVLMPGQNVFNDINYCFQWFNAWEQGPDGDEPVSIHSMITAMVRTFDLDPARIFVTGHSAGGSMALILMASYPDLIAGGGTFGSLPVGQSRAMVVAPYAMAGFGTEDAADLAARITERIDWKGPWPRLSVWHGSDDLMIGPSNGPRVRNQWLGLMGLQNDAPVIDTVGPYRRETWTGPDGRPAVQYVDLQGIGHSVPVDAAHGCGVEPQGLSQLVSDVGVCSSLELLKFWGVAAP